MEIQATSQKNFYNSVAEAPAVSLDQMMASKAPVKVKSSAPAAPVDTPAPEIPVNGVSKGEGMLRNLILDGTTRSVEEIIDLFGKVKSDDGKPCFSNITEQQIALANILESMDAAPPGQYDPAARQAVHDSILYLLALEPVLQLTIDRILRPSVENGAKFSEEDDPIF